MNKNVYKKALFVDRDGVLNIDYGYTYQWSENLVIKDSINLIKRFNSRNYLVFIITNQSGIGRGYYSNIEFHTFMKNLIKYFKKNRAFINDYFFCPCNPNFKKCINRKPNPGLIFQAEKKYNLNLKDCFLVGDKISDIQAGFKSGISNLFLYENKNLNEFTSIKNYPVTVVKKLDNIN